MRQNDEEILNVPSRFTGQSQRKEIKIVFVSSKGSDVYTHHIPERDPHWNIPPWIHPTALINMTMTVRVHEKINLFIRANITNHSVYIPVTPLGATATTFKNDWEWSDSVLEVSSVSHLDSEYVVCISSKTRWQQRGNKSTTRRQCRDSPHSTQSIDDLQTEQQFSAKVRCGFSRNSTWIKYEWKLKSLIPVAKCMIWWGIML